MYVYSKCENVAPNRAEGFAVGLDFSNNIQHKL